MVFYNASTKQGICQEIDRLCDTDDTSYPRLDKTARVNQSFEELAGELLSSAGGWQFDDTNYTTLPVGTQTLVEGQQAYTFTDKFLTIEQVEIKDKNGVYRKIQPIDYAEIPDGMSAEEYFGVDSSGNPTKGFPEYYDKQADTIRLFVAPTSTAVTLASGIRIRFKRTVNLFTAASTTDTDSTVPGGLPSTHHHILAYMGAIPHCAIYKKDRVPMLVKKVDEMKASLKKHFARREQDKRKVGTTNSQLVK